MGNRAVRKMTLAVKRRLVPDDCVFCSASREVIAISTCIVNQSMPCTRCIGCANYKRGEA